MKRQFKTMAVLSTAAILGAIAPNLGIIPQAPSTAYAANEASAKNSWVEEDGNWRFYDADGYAVTDTWKKSGDDWYYLNDEGFRAKETQVEEYYVDAEGKMVKNAWVSIANEDYWDSYDEPEHHWYYFGRDGKATVSRWLTLDGNTYYFNEDGHMMTGKIEVDGYTYYLGEAGDGVRKTGWISLEDSSEDPASETAWYYFDQKGRMVVNDVDKKIDGAYYTFIDGKMQTGWVKVDAADAEANTEAVSAEGYQYYMEDGKRANGWLSIEGIPGLSEEGETHRFYFKNGKPYFSENGIQTFTISGKRYAFNQKGEMQTGKQVVTLADGEIANQFFGSDGAMQTGKQTIYDEELGESQTWFFYTDGARKGQGFHGVKDGNIYVYGQRQDAEADLKYAPVEFDGQRYLVNASGSIQKATSSSTSKSKPDLGKGFKDFEDANGNTWTVNKDGIIQ